jgi:hypothetical protein
LQPPSFESPNPRFLPSSFLLYLHCELAFDIRSCFVIYKNKIIKIAASLVAGDAEVGAHLPPVDLVERQHAPRVARQSFRPT